MLASLRVENLKPQEVCQVGSNLDSFDPHYFCAKFRYEPHCPPERRSWCAQQPYHAKHASQPSSAVPHEVCSFLPAVPMVVMRSPISMRVPVVSSMIISALSVPVVSPTHDHGRWDDHDRGR